MKRIASLVSLVVVGVGVLGCSVETAGEDPATDSSALSETYEVTEPRADSVVREEVTCRSTGEYATCRVNPRGGRIIDVRIVGEHSGAGLCQLGQSFGNGPDYVWVDRGCHADFEVSIRVPTLPTERFGCGTNGPGRRYCQSRFSEIRSVRLIRQDSRAPCQEGVSFGFQRNAIWVERGCAGIFEVAGIGASMSGSVELYDRFGFGGRRHAVANHVVRDLRAYGFDDVTESIIVYDGVWEACDNPDFWGLCQQFGPGRYASLGGMGRRISSIRRIR